MRKSCKSNNVHQEVCVPFESNVLCKKQSQCLEWLCLLYDRYEMYQSHIKLKPFSFHKIIFFSLNRLMYIDPSKKIGMNIKIVFKKIFNENETTKYDLMKFQQKSVMNISYATLIHS